MNELVSIIMPLYNTAKYIEDSIKSVIDQTYQNWELIIIDDCSSDNSLEIVSSFSDDRIILLKNEKNLGAAVSRNRGLREAKGRWIAFLDSDDVWLPNKLERQIQFMTENGYAFTYTDYRICLNGKWNRYINTGPKSVNRRNMYRYCWFSTITVMYDTKVVGLIQAPDIRKNNDYAMWLKVIEKSDAYRLPECLSYYIKHDDSATGGNKLKLISWHYKLFKEAMGENSFIALWHTFVNLFFGTVKKLFYAKKI